MFLTLPKVAITVWWCVLKVPCTLRILLSGLVIVVKVVCRETPVIPEATRFRSPVVVPVILSGVIT